MRRCLVLLVLLGSSLLVGSAKATAFDPAYVAVFFANPYPLSPVKSLRGLLMELWGETHAAMQVSDAYTQWQRQHLPFFTERLLDMNTMVDLFCVEQAQPAEDIQSLMSLIFSLERRVYELTAGLKEDEVGCVKVVLDRIKKKMEQINASAVHGIYCKKKEQTD